MIEFEVWAPLAHSVDIVLDDARYPLTAGDKGYWRIELDESRRRSEYRYSIDGAEPLPDPRSRWQANGVHGRSALVDLRLSAAQPQASRFRAKPLCEAIIYELHVGTFTAEGTYAAVHEKLDYLTGLGVTHIEIMPLATFPGRHGWGYDGVDWYAPHPAYGTPQELLALVNACHRRGLAVLLDVVYNHLGPDGNYLARFGPYFTDRIKTAWGDALNYDGPHSDEVRHFVIGNARMWLADYGFDGLRLDAVHAIYSFEAVHVLEDLALSVNELAAELDRPLILIAESDLNDPRLILPPDRGGYGLNAQWSDDFHHSLHRFFTGESGGYYADFNGLSDVAKSLAEGFVYQGQYSLYRGRRHGKAPRHVEPQQLVVFAQNHDQVGNRAFGERLSMLLDTPKLKAIAALTMLSPFTPMLFQGEEWGAKTPFLYFTDHSDPHLGGLVAEGRRREFKSFGWAEEVPNPQHAETFLRSKLNWGEASQPWHADMLRWYRRLIAIRSGKLSHHGGEPQSPLVDFDAAAGWLTFSHQGVLAVFNFAARRQRVPFPPGEWELALCSEPARSEWTHDVGAGATGVFVNAALARHLASS